MLDPKTRKRAMQNFLMAVAVLLALAVCLLMSFAIFGTHHGR